MHGLTALRCIFALAPSLTPHTAKCGTMEDANARCDEWGSGDGDLAAEDSLRDASLAAAAISRRRSACLGYLLPDLVPDGRGPQGKKARREQIPFTWDAHLLLLTEEEFKRRYRLDFDSFNELLEMIRPALELSEKGELQAKRSNFGIVVSAEVKLAICLRYLAGGDVLDLKLIYHVSRDPTPARVATGASGNRTSVTRTQGWSQLWRVGAVGLRRFGLPKAEKSCTNGTTHGECRERGMHCAAAAGSVRAFTFSYI